MAGDWIKMRSDLDTHLKSAQIAERCSISIEQTVFNLYRVAAWFSEHGKHGQMKCSPSLIDFYVQCDGFADSMMKVGWLRHDYKLILIGFCDVSARRKSLGRKIRSSVLNANSICAICGTNEGLVIDHIVPVSRGGGSELSNLQSLCRSCNAQKGTRTMNEFLDFLRTMEEILK